MLQLIAEALLWRIVQGYINSDGVIFVEQNLARKSGQLEAQFEKLKTSNR